MKHNRFIKLLSLSFALLALSLLPVAAQGYGAGDMFGVPRYIVLDPGTWTAATSGTTVSNTPVDIHGYDGIAVVVYSSMVTNAAATTYARVEGSSTGTNGWYLITNCAAMTLSTNTLSNLSQTGIGATNIYLLPGTVSTATVGTAGFAGTYLSSPAAFTSAGVLLTNVAGGVGAIGFVVADQPRFIHTICTTVGGTNATSAVFIGRKNTGNFY